MCAPATLTNSDLSTFLDTSDQWIVSRTGMHERRISHVGASELAYVAGAQALACAGRRIEDIDMIVVATCSPDSMLPNISSYVLEKMSSRHQIPCFDLNTACTGFMSAVSMVTAYIRSGGIKRALVIGADCLSHVMPWHDRSICILFGDAAGAAVLESTEADEGVLGEKMLCIAEMRDILEIKYGCASPFDTFSRFNDFNFQGPDIFKHAVNGMVEASKEALSQSNLSAGDIDICIPHQANKRILDAVEKWSGLTPGTVYSNVHRYANTSAATIPVAMTEALEEGLIKPGANMLLPAFGGGLTCTSHCLRWGQNIEPVAVSDVSLPPCDYTGLELVDQMLKSRGSEFRIDPKA